MSGHRPEYFVDEMPLMAGRIRQVEQIDFPAAGQIQRPQIIAQHIDFHVAVGDTVAYLFGHPLAPGQNFLVIVRLNGQNGHAGETIGQIHGVGGKHQHFAVDLAAEKETQRLPGIVEGVEGHHINRPDGELLTVGHGLRPDHFQFPGGAVAHVDGDPAGNNIAHAPAVVFVFVADQTRSKIGHFESRQLLQFAVGYTALQKNAGIPVAYDIGVAV